MTKARIARRMAFYSVVALVVGYALFKLSVAVADLSADGRACRDAAKSYCAFVEGRDYEGCVWQNRENCLRWLDDDSGS